MNWGSPEAFFAMGGYGTFVWGSYAVTLVLMLVEPAMAVLRYRAARRADADDPLESE
jgi:heme exporter protein D